MTNEQHKKIHIELHKKLDELCADYIQQTGKLLSNTSVMELIKWSYNETLEPSNNATTI